MKVRVDRAWFEEQMRRGIGLGDVVKTITNAVGLRTCDGCERRRRALNRFRLPRIPLKG
jgi:pantoate kinase